MENQEENTVLLSSFAKNVVVPYEWVFDECIRFAKSCCDKLTTEEERGLGETHNLRAGFVLTAQAMTAHGILVNLQHSTICNLARHLVDADEAAKQDCEMLEDLMSMGMFGTSPGGSVE